MWTGCRRHSGLRMSGLAAVDPRPWHSRPTVKLDLVAGPAVCFAGNAVGSRWGEVTPLAVHRPGGIQAPSSARPWQKGMAQGLSEELVMVRESFSLRLDHRPSCLTSEASCESDEMV